ncbi:MAG: hypothetical protein PF542_01620 [Nanoarchaeota archaeon]|nr:hypothetical protein [Nanoarchaeota archaeon]
MTNCVIHDYKKIVWEIRKKSFPEIKGKILIIETKRLPFWAFFIWFVPGIRIIFINYEKTKGLSKFELKALFVHELCHAIQGKRIGYFLFWIKLISYLTFGKRLRAEIENEADNMAVDRGYFKGIYSVTQKIEDAREYSKYYLTAKQIREYYYFQKDKNTFAIAQ